MKIAIALPCYKRVNTLNELCQTLLRAEYEGDPVTLVFSIDYSGNDAVTRFANDFKWPFGPKCIVEHKTNIGLRNNILFCGDLTSEYDAVIVVEDDLEVSRSFYRFAKGAALFYENDDRIAGVSIYQYFVEEVSHSQFIPLYEGYDAYFLQWASSWGQLWTRSQWQSFRMWYNNHHEIDHIPVPNMVKKWEKSWKKYYIAYLQNTNRFFVFPFLSFVYNGNKAGGEHTSNSLLLITSSPLDNSLRKNYLFPLFDDVSFKYDCFFQLTPRNIRVNNREYYVEFDLFGDKEYFVSEYVITSRKNDKRNVLFSFSNGMLPLENNILFQKKGSTFNLLSLDSFKKGNRVPLITLAENRQELPWQRYLNLFINRMLNALRRRFLSFYKREKGCKKTQIKQ